MITNRTKEGRPYKIAVIGGCHITGYLVGRENSFVEIFSRQLNAKGIDHELSLFPYITLNKPGKLKAIFNGSVPDVLIMQMGNFEFSTPSFLRNTLKQVKRKISKPANPNISSLQAQEPATKLGPQYFNPSLKSIIWQEIKHLSNLAINYSYFDSKGWNAHIDTFFYTVKILGIKNVIVLEPLPTANKVVNRYRKKGGELLKLQAKNYGYRCLNGIHESFSRRLKHFTVDEMHLNAQAHQILANMLVTKYNNLHRSNIASLHQTA